MSLIGVLESKSVLVAPPGSSYDWDNEYLFEETTGSIIEDNRGNFNATAFNNSNTSPTVFYNLNVSGFSGSGIHVLKPTVVKLRPSNQLIGAGNQNLTVMLHAKCDYEPVPLLGQRVFVIHNSSLSNTLVMLGFHNSNEVFLWVTGSAVYAPMTSPLGWNEIGFTYNGSVFTLYVDRQPVATLTKNVASTTAEPAKICFAQGNTNLGFDGTVDNLRIKKAVLTDQEILES